MDPEMSVVAGTAVSLRSSAFTEQGSSKPVGARKILFGDFFSLIINRCGSQRPHHPQGVLQRPGITAVFALFEQERSLMVHIYSFGRKALHQGVLQNMHLILLVVEDRAKEQPEV